MQPDGVGRRQRDFQCRPDERRARADLCHERRDQLPEQVRHGQHRRLGYYKTYDPVGELYYEALRYFQGLPPSPQAISPFTADATKADGFPVYTTADTSARKWTDPCRTPANDATSS